MVTRYDVGSLKPAQKRADGRLIVDAHLTRSGVFTYRNPDGSARREYRPPDEVSRADSLASFAMVPVTNDHPTENVTSKNARKYAVGSVGSDVRMDGDHVAATIVVFDEATVAAMTAGKRDVSCGYECDLDETPGVAPSGERYDAIQRNIVGNHLAIVSVGRAGSARVRMDGAVQQLDGADSASDLPTKDITMDDLKKALADAATAAARADAAEKALGEARTELSNIKARLDSATTALESEKKLRTDAADAFPKLVQARVRLEQSALSILGKDFKTDGLSDRDLRLAALGSNELGAFKATAEHDDTYIKARFDSALDFRASVVRQGQADIVAAGRLDGGTGSPGVQDKAQAARAAMVAQRQAQNSIDAAHAAGK